MSFFKSVLKKSGLAYQQVEDEINLDHDQPASSDSQSAPENKASLLSRLSFWWAQPLVKLGASRTLRRDDLGPFPSDIHTAAVDQEFLKIYDQQVEKSKLRINSEPTNLPEEQRKFLEKEEKAGFVNSIKWLRNSPLFRSFIIYGYRTLFWGGLLKFVAATGQVVSPLLLKLLLEHLGAVGTIDKQPIHFGYFFALGLFISAFTQAYALQCLYWIGFKFGSCYREACMSLVYRKLLRLSAASKRQATTGQMMNLVSVDAMRLMDFTWNPHDWWASPLIISANMCVLYYMVGYPAIVGGLMLLALGGVNYYVTKLSLRYQEEIIGVSDDRISKISEMLTNIKFLKLYSWENIFRERATNVRESELSLLKKIAYLRALSSFLWTISPAIVSLLTFTLFTLTGGILTPSLAFTILAVNNSIREPIGKFFGCMNELLKAWISTKRIGDFLSLEELDEPQHVQDSEYAVQINGDFTWDVELSTPTMEDLSLKIPHGKLFIVVGPVGSGKTSLISAILGDIKRTKGDVLLSGKTVATSQSAWLMNASLRENILFGEPFNQAKYDKVIDRCALRRDIDGFTGGDQTEIGERGINLSGGQKQRVALARALYRESDIYIFDEPLGAVDSTVANWIFHECLMSHLAGKTRILVTHQLQFLPFADTVIVMENGRIKHKGTYNELMASGVELSSIVKNHTERLERIRSSSALLRKNSQEDLGNVSQEWENKIPPSQKNEEQQIVQEKKKPTPKLIQDEESEVGPLGFAIFGKYFGSSGNKHLFIIVIFFYLFSQMVRVGNDYWLVLWTGNAITPNPGIFFYLGIYAIWFLFSSSFVLTRELILAYSTLNCARNLHTNMLDCMLRAPMSFFDSTPIGRIVNRFSKDQSSIDDLLSSIFADVGHCGVTVLSTVVLICVLFPLLVPPMIGIAVLYFLIQRYYRRTARELKTMDAISRSPIFSYFSESANGVNTIRAYGRQTEFHKEFMNRVDDNEQCFYWHFAVNRWLGVRLEFVSALVVLATAMFSVTSANLGALETGLAGLSLSYALSITANLNWFVRQYTEMEINMTSVQRILQYTEVKSEAPIIIPNNRPQESWPEKPVIDFKKLFVRYTQGADYVLKGITCQIQPNEKIGIVGRTGAGKSSLTATLFRLIEAASGQIDIDNVNIADIGLFDLRTKLSIIPQDPFLFHGTIRFNLDPAGNHSDFEIWEALKKVNLKTIVENLPQQLDTHINENGDNFSLGQKQLFSLCRVILHKTKILILDEATASLDLETDEIIQTTVRKEFHDSTVLTIAHRLDTIIDSDRVMVLDKGELKELDKPEALLSNPDSIFSNLVSSALEATSQNKNRLEMS